MPKISRTRRLARPQATSTADYYPQTRADVSLAAAMLRRGREPAALLPPPRSPHRLPPGKPALPFELVDMILREAEYWTRSSVRKTRKSVVQQASPWMPYLESDPITDARRLRRMQINVVGHDQGWADNLSASYSFYELGWRRGGLDSQVTRGPRLFEHEVAKRERQVRLHLLVDLSL